jgi:hypothetical protein
MKKKKYVYSVVSTDDTPNDPVSTQVVGSYRKREDAVTACVDYIMERLVLSPDIRYALLNDVNHNPMKFLLQWTNVSRGRIKRMFAYRLDDWKIPEEVAPAVRLFAREVSEGGIYEMRTEMESPIGCCKFKFEIQENELK